MASELPPLCGYDRRVDLAEATASLIAWGVRRPRLMRLLPDAEAVVEHDPGAAERPARKLIAHCLEELPGSYEFQRFAAEIGADLPPRARQVADERSRAQALIGPVQAD